MPRDHGCPCQLLRASCYDDRMRFRLRTLVLTTAIVPAAVGYVVTSFRRKYDGALVFDWPDPLLTLGIIGWIGIWAYFIQGPANQANKSASDPLTGK